MIEKCGEFDTAQSFIINISFHVVILFILLSGLFIFYISHVIRDTFDSQINGLLRDSLNDYYDGLEPNMQDEFDKLVDGFDFGPLLKETKGYSDATNVNNMWVHQFMISTSVVGIIVVMIMIMMLKYYCNYNIYLVRILIMNLAIFFFVGIIELVFFIKISTKYIPVMPSFLITELVTNLKSHFK
jgi:hypothetical protein